MLPKTGFCVSLIIGAVAVHPAENPHASDLPNESEIRNMLAERIEARLAASEEVSESLSA